MGQLQKPITCFFAKPSEKVVSLEEEDVNKESCATSFSKVPSTLEVLAKYQLSLQKLSLCGLSNACLLVFLITLVEI